jgi:hypothetical protein
VRQDPAWQGETLSNCPGLASLLRGDTIRNISDMPPGEIHLLVCA